jgi:hypothetical protein
VTYVLNFILCLKDFKVHKRGALEYLFHRTSINKEDQAFLLSLNLVPRPHIKFQLHVYEYITYLPLSPLCVAGSGGGVALDPLPTTTKKSGLFTYSCSMLFLFYDIHFHVIMFHVILLTCYSCSMIFLFHVILVPCY